MNLHFKKLTVEHLDTVLGWLQEPHIQEFWDNSVNHKNDIINFAHGRKTPSDYFAGLYQYFIGYIDKNPFAMLMIIKEEATEDRPIIKQEHLSTSGSTYSIDFMIGNYNYIGKGLAAKTLETFITFVHSNIDTSADTFFIDPDITNPKAMHVYEKAGFKYIGDFIMEEDSTFHGNQTHFLIKNIT